MNWIPYKSIYAGNGYFMYTGVTPSGEVTDAWDLEIPFAAGVSLNFDKSQIADWPAIAVRAGNFTTGDNVAEITGAVYLSQGGGNGNCRVIDPQKPPPLPIAISVTAPDWNLGELPEGNGEKVFSSGSDQLCFTYSGAATSGKQFIINAGNANGVVSNRYRLKNLNDASQLVPYNVVLDSGTSRLSLPNAGNAAVSLNSSGKTCFVPTFKTTVDPSVKAGDYSDVLTFTVITKS